MVTSITVASYYHEMYGVNERSALLNTLNWGLPHDIMHDYLEGIVQYDIKLLLLHCMTNEYFTLTDFNCRLLSFEYGYAEVADKPTAIASQH